MDANWNQDAASQTLAEIMKELGHFHIDILKFDVEGEEWNLLETENWKALNIGQLMMEWHFDKVGSRRMNLVHLLNKMVKPLERAGSFPQTTEPVSAGGTGYEMTFLNVNWSPCVGKRNRIFNSTQYQY